MANKTSPCHLVGNRWVEIDTDALRFNFRQVQQLVGPEVQVLAVVKADAYGLGAVEVSRVLLEAGATMLGVTTVDEGIELRLNGIEAPILVFSPFWPGQAGQVVQYRLTPAVSSMEQVEALAAATDATFPVHLKVETGMGRTGLLAEEIKPFLEKAAAFPHIYVEGIFTHFAGACREDDYTRRQFAKFQQALDIAAGMGFQIPLRHACNSAATLDLPGMHLDMVRVGTVLYGQHPALAKNRLELQDPWQIKARIIHLREVTPGTSVGYGREYIAAKPVKIGVLPLGWADGLTVLPAIKPKSIFDLGKMLAKLLLDYIGKTDKFTVEINGKKYNFAGRLGMQLSMVELDDRVQAGDEALVSIRRLSANPRLPRVYFKAGEAYLARVAGREWKLAGPPQADTISEESVAFE